MTTNPENDLKSALADAAAEGNVNRMAEIVLAGANVHWRITRGESILHLAADKGHLEAARYLVHQGISVDVLNFAGTKPIDKAILNEDMDMIRLLIDEGADLGTAGLKQLLPLAVAAGRHSPLTVPIMRLLVQHGANPRAFSPTGLTALHRAVKRGVPETVIALIQLGADIHAVDRDGESSIDIVRSYGILDLLETMLAMESAQNAENAIQGTTGDPGLYKLKPV